MQYNHRYNGWSASLQPLREAATPVPYRAPYQLAQGDDSKHDQQQNTEQEEYPRDIGHGVAKPVLMTRSIRDICNYEEDYVCDSEIDQIPTPDNHLRKPTDRGFATHRATSPYPLSGRAYD